MKKILVINKRYYDKNGNLKYKFNIFNAIGDCINKDYKESFSSYKDNLIAFYDKFRDFSNNDNFIIIDLDNKER